MSDLTRYTIELRNPRGGQEFVDFEGPAGLTPPEIQHLADNYLATAQPGQRFRASVFGGEMPQRVDQPQVAPDVFEGQGAVPDVLDNTMPGPGGQGQGRLAVGAIQGAAHTLDNAADLAEGAYNNTLGRLTGESTSADTPAFENAAANLGRGDPMGDAVGRIGSAALLTRNLGGPILQGAEQGALLSDAETAGGVALDSVAGAAGSFVGDRAVRGVAGLVHPNVPPAARRLHDAGTRLTPGQAIPAFRRTEERLTSRPFIGDRIVEGRRQSYRDFNRAALNETVAPYNAHAAQAGGRPIRVPETGGHNAIKSVGDQASSRYENLIPRLELVSDGQFADDMGNLSTTLRNGDMSPAAFDSFEGIVRNQIMSRLRPGTRLDGTTYRQIERNVGRQIARHSRSQEPDNQALAEAFRELQGVMQGALQRSNPQFARELAALNETWANLVRIEGAGAGAKAGLFSPLQLRQAVRRADASTRGRGMARGEARMQQLAEDGSEVLPSEYPDSGTAGRSQANNPLDPRYWYGALQGMAYGPDTQRLITNIAMTPRPAFAEPVAQGLKAFPAGAAGAAGAIHLKNALLGF